MKKDVTLLLDEYGNAWSKEIMEDADYIPSLEDILGGISQYFEKEIVAKAAFITDKPSAVDSYKQVFEFIQTAIAVKEPTKSLWRIEEGNKDYTTDRNLLFPRSKIVALLLYLCSLEPSLLQALNTALRMGDRSNLESLGAFARALSIIDAGTKEKEQDKIT